MSPAILTDDNGDVQLVIGASGGKRITTAVSLVRRYSVGSSLQETRWDEKGVLDRRLGEICVKDWLGLGREGGAFPSFPFPSISPPQFFPSCCYSRSGSLPNRKTSASPFRLVSGAACG